jgi:peptidoglycan/LPS O-acetylase OafA/YrhL
LNARNENLFTGNGETAYMQTVKHRFEVLDIFRGLFASMVVLFHLSTFSDTPIINNSFVYNSDLFVDFFFILSGFVIAYTYQSMQTTGAFKTFLTKRFFRLYPLHVIMLLMFVGVELGKKVLAGHIAINQPDNINNNTFTFFSNLLFLHSIKLPGVTDVSWNIPSWSISAEMIAYLVFGYITLTINRHDWGKYKNIFYGFTALAGLGLLYLINHNFHLTYSFDYGFLRAIAGFFTGVLCFNSFLHWKKKADGLSKLFFSFAELIILLLMIIMVSEGFVLKEYGFIYELLFFLAIFIYSFERGFMSELLKKSTFLSKLGKYSYSVYMTHALLLSLFNILFIRILHFPTTAYSYLFLLNFLLIYVVSGFTYRQIELRFNWKKKQPVSPAAD